MTKKIYKKDIERAVQGKSRVEEYNPQIAGVVTDSRKVERDFLYVAIPGERVDGHDFIEEAIAKGAALVFSQCEKDREKEVVLVEDTVQALGDLAKFYLEQFDLLKIAVTGSCGKTTTKDMIYYALCGGWQTHRSEGNHNNEIGLPLSVMQMPSEAEVAIFEMGMYTFGEIDALAKIVRPNIAVITNIGTCHIEHLGTRENIFKAKMEIAGYLEEKDTLIVNGDDEYLKNLISENPLFRLITYGLEDSNDVQAYDIETRGEKSFFRIRLKEGVLSGAEDIVFELPAIGIHNIQNALAAVACGMLSGLSQEVIAKGLRQFRPSAMRMDIREKNGVTFINDAYNASPESMRAVIDSMALYGEGRKIAVLGDMLELGEMSRRQHEQIGRLVAEKFDAAIFVGQQMCYAYQAALVQGMKEKSLFHCLENAKAAEVLRQFLQTGDTVLLKGSRGMHIDEIADQLIDGASGEF